ncbi:MAG TPA: hypothetical protein ENK67_02515, partial [Flavobacteriia bacterium]|nr:hypothetical protein [Flavobacteriia bacterium]
MKKQLFFLFFYLSFLFSFTQEIEKKLIYSKAKIFYNNPLDLVKLSDNGVAVDHGLHKNNVFIESVFSQKELETAKALGYSVEVVTKDMQTYLQNRKSSTKRNAFSCSNTSDYQTPSNFELGSMGGFYTLDEMLLELDAMHNLYPNLITLKAPINNFQTEEGRSIFYVKISDNPSINESEPEILYTAMHHAREPASMQQLIFYMWYLLENYATNNEVKAIVDNTQLYFVPIVNPDGYRYNQTTNPNGGGYWRKNRKNNGGSYGVDNNRNYAYHWGESGVSGPSGDTYNGTAPFSEVENQAIKWLSEQHQFQIALNNHTYSSLLLYPFGYANNTPTIDDAVFQEISGFMVQQNGYLNEIASDLYPAAGDSNDWMYGDTSTKNKIFAMTPEIGNSFWPEQSEILPICKDMMFLNLTASHLVNNYAKLDYDSNFYVTTTNFDVNYVIKCLGFQAPSNFIVSLVPITSNIVSVGSQNTHNNMNLQEVQSNSISVELTPSIQQGDTVSYKLVLYNGNFEKEFIINQVYGTPTEEFYANGNVMSPFVTNNWGISQSSFYSAPYSITDSQNSNYDNNANTTIECANAIDLTDATQATISFFAKWDIEKSWDYVQFEISTDNGINWIPQCGKFTNNGTTNQGIENQPMYDGLQSSWVKETINLNDYIGENIKFRFHLVSDSYTTADGFYFDELTVQKLQNTSASINENTNEAILIYPNPSSDYVTIKCNLEEKFSIFLTDISGKHIINKKEFIDNKV